MCSISSMCAKEKEKLRGSSPTSILFSETGTIILEFKKLILMAMMKQNCFCGHKVQRQIKMPYTVFFFCERILAKKQWNKKQSIILKICIFIISMIIFSETPKNPLVFNINQQYWYNLLLIIHMGKIILIIIYFTEM